MSPQLEARTQTVDTPTPTAPSLGGPGAHDLLIRGFRLMESWDDAEAWAIIAAHYTNAEASPEPPPAHLPGVAGVRATYDWLHAAYEDLHWTLDKIVAEGEWVVARATMSGRHTGPFTTYTPDGRVASEIPPTGRPFAVSQSHWYRIADGQLVEHQADRDDLGQAIQLGWFSAATPPTDQASS